MNKVINDSMNSESSTENVFEILRFFFARTKLSPNEANLAIAQLAAWIKLSVTEQISERHSFRTFRDEAAHGTAASFKTIEQSLTESSNEVWRLAFEGMNRNLESNYGIDPSLLHLLDSVYATFSTKSINWSQIAAPFNTDEIVYLPDEVISLAITLLELAPNEQVYGAFQSTLGMALKASQTNKMFLECESRSSLVACIAILADNLQIAFSDPISEPYFTDGGKLKLFDKTLLSTRFGARQARPIFDVFNRFTDKGNYSESSEVQHILAQTAKRAVVIVPNGLLFRTTSSEREFKKKLIESGCLKAVIALPAGLLNGSALPINLLVLDKTEKSENAFFIDASTQAFVEPRRERRSSRNRLINAAEILELFKLRTATTKSRFITRQECEESDYDLLVSKFFLSIEEENIEVTLSKSKTTPLSDLATIIRGQAVKAGTEPTRYQYCEVGAIDIWGSGLITGPLQKNVYIDVKEAYSDSFQSLVLEPGDLVLAVKGSVGIVGLVPDWMGMSTPKVPLIRMEDMADITDTEGVIASPLNWIVGQSYVIIRPHKEIVDKMTRKKSPGMAPEVLLMYLKSALAQTWIKSKAAGSTVPLLKTQYIQTLPVIVPSLENQELIKQRHEKLCKIEDQKNQLECDARELLDEPWPTEWISD